MPEYQALAMTWMSQVARKGWALALAAFAAAACGRWTPPSDKLAMVEASGIRHEVHQFQGAVGNTDCPTREALERYEYVPTERWRDPWGGEYRHACVGSSVSVRSDGPDRVPGTPDDIEFTEDSVIPTISRWGAVASGD